MLNRITKMTMAAAAMALAGAGQAQADMLVELNFNETGTTATNTATGEYDADGDGTMATINDGQMFGGSWGNAQDMHSADGTGVTGLAGDRAFDASGAVHTTIPGALSMQDFTISGWFKTNGDTAWGGDDGTSQHLLYGLQGSAKQFRLRESETANVPELFIASTDVGGDTSYVADSAIWTDTQEWLFWAVSFEGSATSDTDRVKFYAGSTADSVSLVATADGISRTTEVNDTLIWGNDTDLAKGIDGLLDNVRLHNETLSAASLEQLRSGDVIPEPASVALVGFGAMSMLLRRRSQA